MHALPRRPVLGWTSFQGPARSSAPNLSRRDRRLPTTSGRAAILLALEALKVGPGDRVLVPTYHCPTMISPVIACGATPQFYAIGPHGEARLEGLPCEGAKAILAAHFFGQPQAMSALRRWCDSHGVALIEDCAHAMFGRSEGRDIGSWGDLAICSLTKFLPVSEGGCLVDNRAAGTPLPALKPAGTGTALRAWVDMLDLGTRHARLPGLNRSVQGALGVLRLAAKLGRPARRQASQAADADQAAEHEPDRDRQLDLARARRALAAPCRWWCAHAPSGRNVQRRRHNHTLLLQGLSGLAKLRPLHLPWSDDAVPYALPLWVDVPDPGYAELRRLGMPVARWDRPWPGVPALEGDQGPMWSHHVVQVLCHQDLDDADVGQIITVLRQVFGS